MKRLAGVLFLIYILILYYFANIDTKLLITMNFNLYLILVNIFSTIDIKGKDKKVTLIYRIIYLIIISCILSCISYFVGSIMNIKYLNITNLLCSLFLMVGIIIKLINEYIGKDRIRNIYYTVLFLINIVLVIILKNSYSVVYLYLSSLILFVFIFILFYIFVLRKNIDKVKLNIRDMKKVIVENKEKAFVNIIKSSYLYISLIILYYMLINKYTSRDVNLLLSDTFFFGLLFVYLIYEVMDKFLRINYDDINNYNNSLNKVLDIALRVSILLMVISYPLSKVIFNSSYNFIFNLVILLFFYIIFNVIVNYSIKYMGNRRTNISLLFGLLVKIIFEIPLINSIYRIGYNLILGSILSTSIGFVTTIIISSIFIVRKYKINLRKNFNNMLNIVYSNIIYLLILVLLTLIVKVDSDKYFVNIFVILFYLVVSVIYFVIYKRLIVIKNDRKVLK